MEGSAELVVDDVVGTDDTAESVGVDGGGTLAGGGVAELDAGGLVVIGVGVSDNHY